MPLNCVPGRVRLGSASATWIRRQDSRGSPRSRRFRSPVSRPPGSALSSGKRSRPREAGKGRGRPRLTGVRCEVRLAGLAARSRGRCGSGRDTDSGRGAGHRGERAAPELAVRPGGAAVAGTDHSAPSDRHTGRGRRAHDGIERSRDREVCCTQVEPPSLEAKTISDLRVVSPTAKHCDAVGQAMAFRFREEAAYASVKDQDVVLAVVDVELLPDAAVVVEWPPLRKLPGTRSCEFVGRRPQTASDPSWRGEREGERGQRRRAPRHPSPCRQFGTVCVVGAAERILQSA